MALLDAGERILGAGNPDALSARRLAAEVGGTTRAVYGLFGSMERFLQELCGRAYAILVAEVAAVEDTSSPLEDLVRTGLAFRTFAVGHPHLYRLAFERVTPALSANASVAEGATQTYIQMMRRMSRLGEEAGLDRRRTALAGVQFYALVVGLANAELQSQPPPVGSSFWPLRQPSGGTSFWTPALRAFLTGLQSESS